MKYVSTRGNAPRVDFVEASLLGLASDGGLYSPDAYPQIERPAANESYVQTATRILSAFAGDSLPVAVIADLTQKAYAPFAHQSVAPLAEIGPSRWMMELHHGPTLAFKDVAMRLIAQLYDYSLGQRAERMTILCATSGDTGGAAASAFAGSANIDVVILHPLDRVSPTQRLFMTATGADNVHNLALEGDFDGTQAILKALLANDVFRRNARLAAVNSINWARIAAQSVYFSRAQAQLGAQTSVRFIVPTGNFGDALAAYVASRCGLLTGFDCVTAVNANDAMANLISGQPLTRGPTRATFSPAMDIQLPSNFERLLFEAAGRDGGAVAAAYATLARDGSSAVPARAVAALGSMGFTAERVGDEETIDEIRRTHAETGFVVCPHTAVGLAAARRSGSDDGAIVTLATAHAAKFPETVQRALGQRIDLPERAEAFRSRPEVFDIGPMSESFVRERVENIVRSHA